MVIKRWRKHARSFLVRTISGVLCFWLFAFLIWFWPPLVCMLLIAAALYMMVVELPTLISWQSTWFILLTLFYITIPMLLLIGLYQDAAYRCLIVSVVLAVISFDTGAYLVGISFGRYKIAPRISPGKTGEGLLGGLIAVIITLGVIYWYYHHRFLTLHVLIIGCMIAAAAFVGDLFESWLKRRAGVKDSGSILPGHGGLLDRFDSILVTSVICYACKKWWAFVLCAPH